MNSQDSRSHYLPIEDSNPIVIGPEKCFVSEAQDKDFKITIMKNIFKNLREDMSKSLSEVYENMNT